jgi:hypothetical protein
MNQKLIIAFFLMSPPPASIRQSRSTAVGKRMEAMRGKEAHGILLTTLSMEEAEAGMRPYRYY